MWTVSGELQCHQTQQGSGVLLFTNKGNIRINRDLSLLVQHLTAASACFSNENSNKTSIDFQSWQQLLKNQLRKLSLSLSTVASSVAGQRNTFTGILGFTENAHTKNGI